MGYQDLIGAIDNDTQETGHAPALTLAFDSNPDDEAKKLKLQKSTGIPALLMDDNVRKKAELQQFVTSPAVQSLADSSPKTAKWFSDHQNAKVAHDDIDGLSTLERLTRDGFGPQGGSTLGIASPNDKQAAKRAKSIGGAFVEGLSSAPYKANQGLARTGQMVAEFVDYSLAAFPDETGLRKKVSEVAKQSADYWENQAKIKAPAKQGQTAEYYVQQAGQSIGTSLLAAPFGMGGQNAALAMFGLFADGGYQEMRDKGVSVPVAGALSASNSAMEGLTEKFGLDAIYKGTGPILKKAIGFVLGDLAGEEINTIYNSLVDKVTITPDMTMGDVVQRVVDTAIVTAIAGPVQGVTMNSVAKVSEGLYSNMQARKQAKSQADFLLALGEGVKATKTFNRLPDKVQEFIKAAKEDGPITDVFIPVERFTELFQSQGMDARQAAEQILSDPSRYYEAVVTGGDVAIPLEEFATLAGEEYYAELVKDTKTSIGGMTAREAEAFGNDQEKTINDLFYMAAVEEPPVEDAQYQDAYQRIYDDTYGQLIGVGRNPGQAEADATIRAKGLATLAQRYGYDPAELEKQFPLTVTRGEVPSVLQKQASFSDQQQQAKLNEMLDMIRNGKGATPSELYGPSLVEFLRIKGIKDDQGDLKSMEVDSGIKFKKKLLRKDGVGIDRALTLAIEQGYFSDGSDINALLDAVSNEMQGKPIYAMGAMNEKLFDQLQSMEELAQWLDMMGVDLAQMDNSKIMEMMQQSINAGGMEFNQSGRAEWVDLANSATNKEDLIAGLKKYFGVTRNPLEAGYVLPDGSMLDMSGRHYAQDHPSLRNQRSVDHRELFGENNDGFSIEELLPDLSGSDAMAYVMAVTGAMRIDIASGVASSIGIPTQKQITMLGNALKGEFSAISLINKNTGKIIDETEIDNTNPLKIKKFYEQAESKPDTFTYFQSLQAQQPLFQKDQKKRGYIKYGDSLPGFEIGLLKDADASTFIHEAGHYYHEVLGRLAGQENAPEQLRADYQTLLDWLGATDKQSLTVEQNEKFARGFEAYLYEGNAPSQELRGVFQRFKTWLKAVYSSLKSLNVELTDDVRGVFDRMLATDEEIAAAEREQGVKQIFATAEEAGMSPAVFAAYRKLAEQAHEEAKDRLERKKLKEIKRVHEDWYKEARGKMAEEVETEAKENPVYEAVNFLYTGKLFDGSVFEGDDFKLSKAELSKMYDATALKAIQKKLGWIYRKEGGLQPEVVAEMFGFSSADEMIKKIMEVPKLKEFVKAETDRRMIEQYGEMNAAEIAEEAVNAVHNDDQAKLLREELKAINRKRKEVRPFIEAEKKGVKESRKAAFDSIPPVAFFKEAARRAIAAKAIKEILPGAYGRAEAKAGKEAFDFAVKGDFEKAAEAKQRQLLNHYLYRESVEAREESEKISAYMKKLETPVYQGRIGKFGQDYLDQINNLLDGYEFRRVTNKELNERERLIDWVKRKEEETGISPPIPSSILEKSMLRNYRTLPMSELRNIYDTAQAIMHLARTEGKLFKDQQKRDVMELADEAAASIKENSKGLKKRNPEKNLPQDLPGAIMENYFASHRKMSSLARQMDGGKDGGVMWNLLIRPMNEAGDKETVMQGEAAEKLNNIFKVYSAIERTKMCVRQFIPSANVSISKWGQIVVALNMGNEGNRQRLSTMYGPGEVKAIVDGLDQRDWQFVQNVWDMIDEYWPMIQAKEKRINGIAPERVAPMPVSTKYGTLQGGYYPIKYDREETAKTGAQEESEIYKQMMGGAFTKATTRRGHTEARLENVGRPLSLSIDSLFQHLNQVIHDVTHHEMLMDVNRLLGTSQIQDAIRDHYGMEAYRVFTDGLRDVAVGDILAQDAFEKFMAHARVGISVAGLGFNLVTSMMQPLGFTQSMARIGTKWVGKGIGRWIGTPERMIETVNWIYEKSDFMMTRGKTINREINEARNQMTVGLIPHSVRDSFFYFIQQMQKTVDIPTWLGQYEKSMAEHGNEADAIAEADQAVIDSQASGMMKDLARIQKGGPLKKIFATFYSFFSTTYNLAAESAGKTNFKNPAEVGRFLVDMLMLYTIPPVLSVLLKEAIQRAIGGGDDDDEVLKKLAGEQLSYIMGGFIGLREIASTFSGFQGYEGPAGARVYSESIKLFKELEQGEADAGLFKRLNSVGGILLHYPSTQVQRVVDGMIELSEGRGNFLSPFFGKPKK